MSRPFVIALIVVLCVAALIAIIAIVSGNELDEDAARALGTAAALTLYLLVGLAGRTLSQRRPAYSTLGWITVLIAAGGFLTAIVAIWSEDGGDDEQWEWAGSFLVAALGSSHVSILLRRASSQEADAARYLRFATVLITLLLATLLIAEIVDHGETVDPRAIGVVAVLYVLGTVLLPVIRAGSRQRSAALGSPLDDSAPQVAVEEPPGEPAPETRPRFQGLELRRVLIAPPQGDQRLRILSVELYADGTTVRYAVPNFREQLASRGERWQPPHDEYPFRLTDDHESRYRIYSASGRANDVFHGQVTFVPTVASAARRLTLETATGTLDLELGDVG